MDKKKILIVSHSFFPENSPRSFRTTELAKEFARRGHLVKLITHKKPEQDELIDEFGFKIKDLGKLKWKPFTVKGSGLIRLFRRAMVRFSGLLFEYPNIQLMGMVNDALKDESGYDLLISIAMPHPVHWGVASVRSIKHMIAKVWVADCGDPYMGGENDTFKPPFYFKYVEKWFCRKADYVSVPTEGAIQAYYPNFHSKIRVIPQGFRFEDFVSGDDLKKQQPNFAYAGGFIQGRRDPTEMLDYLLTLDVDFRFKIYTSSPEIVNPYAKKSNGKIIVLSNIPRTELLKELYQMDFVVNFENAGNKQTPSKLIDYAIINKPVLSIKTNGLNKKAIDEFIAGNYQQQYIINNPTQYRIENVCNQFLALCQNDDITKG
jgi:glycosyltransferase involved in cell wall biosynthesis